MQSSQCLVCQTGAVVTCTWHCQVSLKYPQTILNNSVVQIRIYKAVVGVREESRLEKDPCMPTYTYSEESSW